MSRARTLSLTFGVAVVLLGGLAVTFGPDDGELPAVQAGDDAATVTTNTGGPASYDNARLEADLDRWQDLHGPKGKLSLEETQALIAERDAAAEAIALGIGALSPVQLAGVLQAWRDAQRTRDQLVLIDGLGRNASGEAVTALEDIYAEDEGYTNRSHVLRALGDSPAAGHTDLLSQEMWGAGDERLSQLAAQGLYGESGAVSTLSAAAGQQQLPMKTRLEAIHSLGATGEPQAKEALESLSQNEEMEGRVRAYADKELVRSFG
jgi:hypothetical protein